MHKDHRQRVIDFYLSQIILILNMKPKYPPKQALYYTFKQQDNQTQSNSLFNRPHKSPSPDKKSANIIVSTKSPEITTTYRFPHTPEKQPASIWQDRQFNTEKIGTISTPSKIQRDHFQYKIQYKNTDETNRATEKRLLSSGVRNTKIEIIASSSPEEFDERQGVSSRIRETRNQLDEYKRLLKSKEETIKQLKEIIALIKRNNIGGDQEDGQNTHQLQQRTKVLMEEAKTLRIENQHLFNIIEKQQQTASNIKLDDSHRKIRELQDIIRERDLQFEDKYQKYEKTIIYLNNEQNRLQKQNQSLLRLLKQKEDLGSSAMSASKSNEKEKLSLTKIKEQYSENLKMMKQSFQSQIQQCQAKYDYQIQQQRKKIDELELRLNQAQQYKNSLLRRLPEYEQILRIRQEYHRQNVRCRELQTLMVEKTRSYEKELNEERKNNQKLITQVSEITIALKQIESKFYQSLQEISQLRQRLQDEDEMEMIVNLKNIVYDENSLLKRQISRLKAQLQEKNVNENAKISQLENKIQTFVQEYERHLIQENAKAQNKLMKQKEFYEKDKLDTEQKAINIFNMQSQEYKRIILQKNKELAFLEQQLQKLHNQHSRCAERNVSEEELIKIRLECSEYKVRYTNAQDKIQKLSSDLVQMDVGLRSKNDYILQLEKDKAEIYQQKEKINKLFAACQIRNDQLAIRASRKEREAVDLEDRIKQLQKQIYRHQQSYLKQLQDLKNENAEVKQKQGVLMLKLYEAQSQLNKQTSQIKQLNAELQVFQRKQKEYVSFSNSDNLEEELIQLKSVVQNYLTTHNLKNQNQLTQEFYKLNYNYEVKLEENVKFMKLIEELRTENAAKSRQVVMLQQKISMLSSNIDIYERELKQRRFLYEELLQQKTRIQKQVLLSKKIKMQQSQRQSSKSNYAEEITSRIDHLLGLQNKRKQNMKGLYIVQQLSP